MSSTANIKRYIRKHTFLFACLRPVYRFMKWCRDYPKKKTVAQIALKKIESLYISNDMRIWFFCVVTHPNLGDRAQSCCIYNWLKENYPNSDIIEITSTDFDVSEKYMMTLLKKTISVNDLLVFNSGFTLTDISGLMHENENLRSKIIKAFPNKIVIFPQTISYNKDVHTKKAIATYNNRNNILLLTRDPLSDKIAKELFPNTKSVLFPDIVTSKIGYFDSKGNRDGILLCIRDDIEQYYEQREINSLIKDVSAFADCHRVDTTDKTLNKIAYNDFESCWHIIEKTIDKYSRYRAIITDRYHGMIFSLIAGTPVIVLKTTVHKTEEGAKWLKDIYGNYVYIADTLDEAKNMARQAISEEYAYCLDNYFDREYYQKLKTIIEGYFTHDDNN